MQAQLARREEHQQRLARPLKMPDQALLWMSGHYAFDDLVHAVVLLVAGDDLDAALLLVCGVAGKIGQQIEQDIWS